MYVPKLCRFVQLSDFQLFNQNTKTQYVKFFDTLCQISLQKLTTFVVLILKDL